jgi:hypothetical protein
MRVLIGWLAAVTLWGGTPPELALPGRDPAFLRRILGDSEGGRRPWQTFQLPPITASAVVEVIGELTPEERRQVAFQEFLAWFYADLRKFLHAHGGRPAGALNLASATLPVERFGGNPIPRNVPIGSVDF